MRQVVQLSQRDRAAGWVSYVQKLNDYIRLLTSQGLSYYIQTDRHSYAGEIITTSVCRW